LRARRALVRMSQSGLPANATSPPAPGRRLSPLPREPCLLHGAFRDLDARFLVVAQGARMQAHAAFLHRIFPRYVPEPGGGGPRLLRTLPEGLGDLVDGVLR